MMKIALIIVSDSAHEGRREDGCGPVVKEMFRGTSEIRHYQIVPDQADLIGDALIHCADQLGVDLVLTSGGTGFSPRDVTPEATRSVIEREAPGMTEAMRMEGMKKTRKAMLSRGCAGIRGRTLIINLPGSPKGVGESLEVILDILPHAIDMIAGKGHG